VRQNFRKVRQKYLEDEQAMTDLEAKRAALQATGTLNPHPETVADPLFRAGGFFDPRDLLQVRYEMVRRHRVEGMPVTTAAAVFGVSLPTAYQAQALFDAGGLAGLLPKRRGPKQGHKLTPQVIAYIDRRRQEQADVRMSQLVIELNETGQGCRRIDHSTRGGDPHAPRSGRLAEHRRAQRQTAVRCSGAGPRRAGGDRCDFLTSCQRSRSCLIRV
jgi:transposase